MNEAAATLHSPFRNRADATKMPVASGGELTQRSQDCVTSGRLIVRRRRGGCNKKARTSRRGCLPGRTGAGIEHSGRRIAAAENHGRKINCGATNNKAQQKTRCNIGAAVSGQCYGSEYCNGLFDCGSRLSEPAAPTIPAKRTETTGKKPKGQWPFIEQVDWQTINEKRAAQLAKALGVVGGPAKFSCKRNANLSSAKKRPNQHWHPSGKATHPWLLAGRAGGKCKRSAEQAQRNC